MHSPKQKYNLIWENAFNAVVANPKRLAVIEMLHCVPSYDDLEIALFEELLLNAL